MERPFEVRTPYMVHCVEHGGVYLSREEYRQQLIRANDTWRCPMCGRSASWDDDNYEEMMEELYPEAQHVDEVLTPEAEELK